MILSHSAALTMKEMTDLIFRLESAHWKDGGQANKIFELSHKLYNDFGIMYKVFNKGDDFAF